MPSGIKLESNTIVFVNDQAICQNNEDDLQRAIFKQQQSCQHYNMKVSIAKTETMPSGGKEQEPIRTKIVLDNQTFKQVPGYRYLGCNTSFYKNEDLDNKLHKFQNICGCLIRILKNKARKEAKLKLYKVTASPTFLYGLETWIMNNSE